ncbi:MAG: sigma-70 family RNA polymerase sigma factor [Gammaproteobacteria bacterium]|nr:sigma-70 family RNA polymerase sigma factor [Gammaproteobacteria bacterium]
MDRRPSVLERIARGDPTAIGECMSRYGGLVWSLARRWSDGATDAEDASQEIFIELWKSAARFDAAAGSEEAFIATIAKRRLIDRLRSRNRRPRTEVLDESLIEHGSGDSDSAGAAAVDAAAAARALELLEPAQREVLLMGIVEGMTHSEIATATGRPLGTVKTQIRRGLIRLRELLQAAAPGRG